MSEVAQSCLTLCDPVDCSPPGSSIHRFSRQEYWSGLPFPSPGDLPNPGIKPALQADALTSESPGKPTFSDRTTSNFLSLSCVFSSLMREFQLLPSNTCARLTCSWDLCTYSVKHFHAVMIIIIPGTGEEIETEGDWISD